MADDSPLDRIEEILTAGRGTRWSLLLTGEKPWNVLQELLHDMQTASTKKIATKFSYIGMAPTIAWANACSDLFYPVMRDSIDAFDRYFGPVLPLLEQGKFQYVSLGVGTGQKDRVVLGDLRVNNPSMIYVPVDISTDMIRLGIEETQKVPGLRVIPVQLDFSDTAHLDDLQYLVNRLVGDSPVLYSLLGNTLANTDDDLDLLLSIGEMLRPQDRLLLEVSTTTDLSEEALREARGEYSNSEAYRVHATSALGQFTDLTIDSRWLVFNSFVEEERAIRIEAHYRNNSDQTMIVALPDHRTKVNFEPAETIRVTLSRKYSLPAVDALVKTAGLTRLNERVPQRQVRSRRPVFSRDLLLLAKQSAAPPKPTVADELLRTGKMNRR